MSRFLILLLLGAVTLIPAGSQAEDRRYYDRGHKDYHAWDEQEERAYRRFLEEKHRKYHDWSKASRSEQNEYWAWRHEHRD